MTDPEYGFEKRAGCVKSPDFSNLYGSLSNLFEQKLLKMFTLITNQVGTQVLGTSLQIIHPVILQKTHIAKLPVVQAVSIKEEEIDVMDVLSDLIGSSALETGQSKTLGGLQKSGSRVSLLYSLEDTMLSAFTANTEILNIPVEQLNAKIDGILKEWLSLSEPGSVVADDLLLAQVVFNNDRRTSRRPSVARLEYDLRSYMLSLQELIRVVPHLPSLELVRGTWFVGQFLCHINPDVRNEASNSLQKLFHLHPTYRTRYIIRCGINPVVAFFMGF